MAVINPTKAHQILDQKIELSRHVLEHDNEHHSGGHDGPVQFGILVRLGTLRRVAVAMVVADRHVVGLQGVHEHFILQVKCGGI